MQKIVMYVNTDLFLSLNGNNVHFLHNSSLSSVLRALKEDPTHLP